MKIRPKIALLGCIFMSIFISSCAIKTPTSTDIIPVMKGSVAVPFILGQFARWGVYTNDFTPYVIDTVTLTVDSSIRYSKLKIITNYTLVSITNDESGKSGSSKTSFAITNVVIAITNTGHHSCVVDYHNNPANAYGYTFQARSEVVLLDLFTVRSTNVRWNRIFTNNLGVISPTNTQSVVSNIMLQSYINDFADANDFMAKVSNSSGLMGIASSITYTKDDMSMDVFIGNFNIMPKAGYKFLTTPSLSFTNLYGDIYFSSEATVNDETSDVYWSTGAGFVLKMLGNISNDYELLSGGITAYARFGDYTYPFTMSFIASTNNDAIITGTRYNLLPDNTMVDLLTAE